MRILTFTIIVALFVSACKLDPPIYPKKTDTTKTKGGDTTVTAVVDSGYYFKGSINDRLSNWPVTDGINGWVTQTIGRSSAIKQGTGTAVLAAYIEAAKVLQPQVGVEFKTYTIDNSDQSANFNSFINLGAWTFAKTADIVPNTKTLVIYFTDDQGKVYTSEGDQTGSSVNIISTSHIPGNPKQIANESLKIKLTFSCLLYPADGTGGTLRLDNGEAVVKLFNFL